MDMMEFVNDMHTALGSGNKPYVWNIPVLNESWGNIKTQVEKERWDDVEKLLKVFESKYEKATKLDLKSPPFQNYSTRRNELLLNIQSFSKSHVTVLNIQSTDFEKPKLQNKSPDLHYLCECIEWIDTKVNQKGQKKEDSARIDDTNVSSEVQKLGEFLQQVGRRLCSIEEAKKELIKVNMSLNKSITNYEKSRGVKIPILQLELFDNVGSEKHGKGEKTTKKIPSKKETILVLQKELDDLRVAHTTLLSKYDQCEKEKDYWMNRMSKVAGERLTANNPGISDLSDPNRPQKIGEKYAELYDNEWTDALEKLNGGKNKDTDETAEIENINKLATFLRECQSICERLGYQQIEKLFHTLSAVDMLEPVTDTHSKTVKTVQKHDHGLNEKRPIPQGLFDARKDTYRLAIAAIKEVVLKELTAKYKGDASAVSKFISTCVEICWEVVIQRPQLYFVWPEVGQNQTVNIDLFAPYTRSGKGIQFIVWPALLLYKDGPVLRKGTYQPFASS